MEEELITLANFTNLQDCYHAQSRLEAEGIEVLIYDENVASVLPGIEGIIGGIRLCVKARQAESALEVMKVINQIDKEREKEREITVMHKVYEKTFGECPKCESENIYTEKLSTFRALISGFRKSEHYCKDCKYVWMQLPENYESTG